MQGGADLESGGLRLAEVGEQGPHSVDPLRVRQLGQTQPGGIVQVVEDGQILEQQIILRDIAEDAGPRGGFPIDVAAIEIKGAMIGGQGAVEEVEQGGFAGAAAAHDGHQAPTLLLEGEVVQTGLAAGEAKLQVLAAQDDGRGGGHQRAEGGVKLRDGEFVAPAVAQHLAGAQGLDVTGCQGPSFQGEGLITQGGDE